MFICTVNLTCLFFSRVWKTVFTNSDVVISRFFNTYEGTFSPNFPILCFCFRGTFPILYKTVLEDLTNVMKEELSAGNEDPVVEDVCFCVNVCIFRPTQPPNVFLRLICVSPVCQTIA